jgi:mannose/fructose/N-acetylgalactosamine-specific phosphotransferase system component IID
MGTAFDPLALVIFFGALYLLRRKKLGTMTVMLLCGAVGVAGYFLSHLFGG